MISNVKFACCLRLKKFAATAFCNKCKKQMLIFNTV